MLTSARRRSACGGEHDGEAQRISRPSQNRPSPDRADDHAARAGRPHVPRLQRRASPGSVPAVQRTDARRRRDRRHEPHRRAHAGRPRHRRDHSAHRVRLRRLDRLDRREPLPRHPLRHRSHHAPRPPRRERCRAARGRRRPHLRHLFRLRRALEDRRVFQADDSGAGVSAPDEHGGVSPSCRPLRRRARARARHRAALGAGGRVGARRADLHFFTRRQLDRHERRRDGAARQQARVRRVARRERDERDRLRCETERRTERRAHARRRLAEELRPADGAANPRGPRHRRKRPRLLFADHRRPPGHRRSFRRDARRGGLLGQGRPRQAARYRRLLRRLDGCPSAPDRLHHGDAAAAPAETAVRPARRPGGSAGGRVSPRRRPEDELNELIAHMERELDIAIRAARDAGQILLRYYDGWLSEETADSDERLERKRVWIVDPLDGTKEFISEIPEFVVCVALVEDGLPRVAVEYNPVRDELFTARKGAGAALNGTAIRVTKQTDLRQARVLASRSEEARGEWDPYREKMHVELTGSVAYKFALIAAGRYDATFTLTPKNEWDVCAGALLVAEAGGMVTDPDGRAIRFNNRSTLLSGLIASNQLLHRAIINTIRATRAAME